MNMLILSQNDGHNMPILITPEPGYNVLSKASKVNTLIFHFCLTFHCFTALILHLFLFYYSWCCAVWGRKKTSRILSFVKIIFYFSILRSEDIL